MRLIRLHESDRKQWEVMWWRDCQFDRNVTNGIPGERSRVDVVDVVDALEGDKKGRQSKRVR